MKYLFIAIGFLALAYSGWFIEWYLGKDKKGQWFTYGILVLALALLATLPLYATSYTPILMTSIIMYVILAISWTMFSGPTGYMSLATAAFFGVGIYAAAFLGDYVPLPVFIIAGGLISSVVAVLVGALTLRLRGIYFAIFTFGLILLISNLLVFWELHVYGTRGRFVVVIDYNTIYYAMFVIFVALLVVTYFTNHSKYGLALQSIGQYLRRQRFLCRGCWSDHCHQMDVYRSGHRLSSQLLFPAGTDGHLRWYETNLRPNHWRYYICLPPGGTDN
jgi:hypothetical protein